MKVRFDKNLRVGSVSKEQPCYCVAVNTLMIFCFCLFFSTGQLKRQYKWSDEETDKNWSGKAGIQQKIADKCRNLNKSFGKKN